MDAVRIDLSISQRKGRKCMMQRHLMPLLAGLALVIGGFHASARAEVSEIGIALSYGIGHLPSMIRDSL